MTDEELDEVLGAYEAPEPPAGFADRVMDAARPRATPARRRAWPWVAAGAVAAAAAAVVLWPSVPGHGELRAVARTEAALGDRGVAVAEPGAHLTWSADDDVAEIDQRAGNVFYRAEPSERFVVHTAAGDVSVRGTCFRVEVLDMNVSPQLFVGVAAGAVLAGSVIVTVYEGEVAAENDHGAVTLAAGERSVMRPDEAPAEPFAADAIATSGPSDRPDAPDAPDAPTRDELAAMSEAELRERVRQLAAQGRESAYEIERLRGLLDESSASSGRVTDFFPASPSQLRQWAEDCQLRVDYPPVMQLEPGEIGSHGATLGLTDEEIPVVQEAIADLHASVNADLQALYIEATGDAGGAAALSSNALFAAIRDVSGPEEASGVLMNRVARERAGMIAPPGADVEQSPSERAIRLFAGLGDAFQSRLAQSLGPDRAYALRATDNGWPWSHSIFTGCPDGE